MSGHPVRLRLNDDLRRMRLAVFFRLILAIPHYLWYWAWTALALVATILNWVSTLILGRPPRPLFRFLAAYTRYTVHFHAYLFLIGDEYPGFTGRNGRSPVDVEIAEPTRQGRLGVFFRLALAVPAFLVASALAGPSTNAVTRASPYLTSVGVAGGVLVTVAFLGWFSSLVRGRMPEGMRNLGAYVLLYVAQLDAYLFLLTDRYPDAAPAPGAISLSTAGNPVSLVNEAEARRSRLTVLFRVLLALPHLVWSALWGVAAIAAAFASWAAALLTGRVPRPLHEFVERFVRYQVHVQAFLYLLANPFPGFSGRVESYPVDLPPIPREVQRRPATAVRIVLAYPALLLSGALNWLLMTCAVLLWFVGLTLGRAPESLQRAGCFALRYWAQTLAYTLLLTDRYPYSGPWAGNEPVPIPAQ